MAGEGLTTTATAAIYVEDVNDNPPEFMSDEVGRVPPLPAGRGQYYPHPLHSSLPWASPFKHCQARSLAQEVRLLSIMGWRGGVNLGLAQAYM